MELNEFLECLQKIEQQSKLIDFQNAALANHFGSVPKYGVDQNDFLSFAVELLSTCMQDSEGLIHDFVFDKSKKSNCALKLYNQLNK